MPTEGRIRPGQFLGKATTFVKVQHIVAARVVSAALFILIGVGHTSGANGGQSAPAQADQSNNISRAAIERFWTVYHGNDYDAIPEVQKELEMAIQTDPNNPTLYALLGATHFWHIGEPSRDPNQQADLKIFAQGMPTAAACSKKRLISTTTRTIRSATSTTTTCRAIWESLPSTRDRSFTIRTSWRRVRKSWILPCINSPNSTISIVGQRI
jgi:hypothetical protein